MADGEGISKPVPPDRRPGASVRVFNVCVRGDRVLVFWDRCGGAGAMLDGWML